MNNRRFFLKNSIAFGILGCLGASCTSKSNEQRNQVSVVDYSRLDKILNSRVFKRHLFTTPIIIDRLELLKYENSFMCRVVSKDGAIGYSISNNLYMGCLYPIFKDRLKEFFIGKDARDIEQLIEDVYASQNNYKLQGIAFWIPLATIEIAILDMLGRIVNRPIGELIGQIYHKEIAVYKANGVRGKSAEETVAIIQKEVEESKAKAVKFKMGGRMNMPEIPVGRTEALIPLIRKVLGDSITIYADANGSYNVEEAIRLGKILQDNNIEWYEEPVPFDYYEDTKIIASALDIPIAGGECEVSMQNFRWMIGNNVLQVVQPDIFYFGGMIRSAKVARMAESQGITCVPHISGSGLGYVYMLNFVATVKNAGKYHEFKGFPKDIPYKCATSDLEITNGRIVVPTGAGSGIDIDMEFIKKHIVFG